MMQCHPGFGRSLLDLSRGRSEFTQVKECNE